MGHLTPSQAPCFNGGMEPTPTDFDRGVARLITKAARRFTEENRRVQREATLRAFAEVAADVFHVAMTPFAFEQAIRDTAMVHPIPNVRTLGRDAAQARREAWEAEFVSAVLTHLNSN